MSWSTTMRYFCIDALSSGVNAALVAYEAGGGRPQDQRRHDLLVLIGWQAQLEIIFVQQAHEDRADLQQRKGIADAFVAAAAEGNCREDILRRRSGRVELFGVREELRQAMRH